MPTPEVGIAQLMAELESLSVERVVLEATGGLELVAAVPLSQVGLPVAVVNLRQARDFARATGQLATTDTIGAAILAHFAEVIQPDVRPLASEETQQLSEFVPRRHQLVEMITAEKNRRATMQGAVRDQIDRQINWPQKQLYHWSVAPASRTMGVKRSHDNYPGGVSDRASDRE